MPMLNALSVAPRGSFGIFTFAGQRTHLNWFVLRWNPIIRCFQNKIESINKKSEVLNYSMESLTENDAHQIIKAITPPLDQSLHKGQAGKIAVIGGCREYTGAPYFAAISALKIGADLSHVFCTEDAATVIKSYSPELIVHPVLKESYNINYDDKDSVRRKVVEDVTKWMQRFDSFVIGPGLGRDPFLMDCVSDIIQLAKGYKIPIVIDGDGLFIVTNDPELVIGYPFAIITPNVNEHKRLVEKIMGSDVQITKDDPKQLQMLAERMGGLTILQKGEKDLISDGKTVYSVNLFGSPRRCGGQGDILSGSVAVFCAWAQQRDWVSETESSRTSVNSMLLGAAAGSTILRKAAFLAFQQHKRSTLTTDIIAVLGKWLLHSQPPTYEQYCRM